MEQEFDPLFGALTTLPTREPKPVLEWGFRFLNKYAETCSIREACVHAGITYEDFEEAKRTNEDFARAIVRADALLADELERVAYDRATNGWMEPVFYQGEECGEIRKFDNRLLLEMLRARKPQLYVERSTSIHVDLKGASLLLPPADVMRVLRPEVLALAERIVRGQIVDTTAEEVTNGEEKGQAKEG